eukprot:1781209-Rhodomonas_salina.1
MDQVRPRLYAAKSNPRKQNLLSAPPARSPVLTYGMVLCVAQVRHCLPAVIHLKEERPRDEAVRSGTEEAKTVEVQCTGIRLAARVEGPGRYHLPRPCPVLGYARLLGYEEYGRLCV